MPVTQTINYACDECDLAEEIDNPAAALGWVQVAATGAAPGVFCSWRCLILHIFQTVAASHE